MLRMIVPFCLGLVTVLAATPAAARSAQLKAAKITTPVGTLEQVQLRLDWPSTQAFGTLQLLAKRIDAPSLGYHFRNVQWQCPLQHSEAAGWQCAGPLRSGTAPPMQLAVQLAPDMTRANLAQGRARITLAQRAKTPDLTTLDLTQVPLAWAQALATQAWADSHLKAGLLSGRLAVTAPSRDALQIVGTLSVQGVGLENSDSSIVAEGLGVALQLNYLSRPAQAQLQLEGELLRGEFLAGNTYVALPQAPVKFQLEGTQYGQEGWVLPKIVWQDGQTLNAQASAQLSAEGALQTLAVRAQSQDMTPLKAQYLSGWMGLVGLSGVELRGKASVRAEVNQQGLESVQAELEGVTVDDPAGRFVFDGLQGSVVYSAKQQVESALRWNGGQLYGLAFGAAAMPFTSAHGQLRVREEVPIPFLDGTLTLRDVVIRPPQASEGMDIRFGMRLADLDFGKLSQALELPAFQGRLGGDIPSAHYANDRIDFDGGLSMQIFDGRVAFSSLSLERPFGTAPSLSADIEMDDLDLTRLTEVLGFGSISGKLDGRMTGFRLVNWEPVAFDARFITDAKKGVKQRISQRAVQDISSVGDASFFSSLQGRLIGLFSDFGYRQIGIGCRLENQICAMSGLHSAGNAFTIVKGKGVPQLDVIGYNRAVAWPTLLERLMAAGRGDVAPVIE